MMENKRPEHCLKNNTSLIIFITFYEESTIRYNSDVYNDVSPNIYEWMKVDRYHMEEMGRLGLKFVDIIRFIAE